MTSARIGKKIAPGFSLDVEFSVSPGVTALFGPSGVGKTLILEALAGFATPDSGRILLDDVLLFDAAAQVSVPPHQRGCGYVAQRDALFPHMTLRQNLAFAAHRSPRVERTRRVAEALDRFELASVAARRPREMGPPEKLRGAVARALLASPKLLLLDDRGFPEALLRKVREVFPGPILLVTNDLDLCCAAAERLILLDAGRIVQSGPPRGVLERPETVDAARVLGIPNVFEGAIAALDPERHSSRLEFSGFAISGPHLPGHFRGDRVSVAVWPEDLRVHAGEGERRDNAVPAELVRVSRGARTVRLEFAGGLFVDVPAEEYEAKKDTNTWQVEFLAEKLRVL
jgi:molybdate transport system ATP-binding protein